MCAGQIISAQRWRQILTFSECSRSSSSWSPSRTSLVVKDFNSFDLRHVLLYAKVSWRGLKRFALHMLKSNEKSVIVRKNLWNYFMQIATPILWLLIMLVNRSSSPTTSIFVAVWTFKGNGTCCAGDTMGGRWGRKLYYIESSLIIFQYLSQYKDILLYPPSIGQSYMSGNCQLLAVAEHKDISASCNILSTVVVGNCDSNCDSMPP